MTAILRAFGYGLLAMLGLNALVLFLYAVGLVASWVMASLFGSTPAATKAITFFTGLVGAVVAVTAYLTHKERGR